MALVLHGGCREVSPRNVQCERGREPHALHEARTSEGKVVWRARARGADATPPLRNAAPAVPDVRA